MSGLKPCPFCGADGEIKTSYNGCYEKYMYTAVCSNPKCEVNYLAMKMKPTEAEAIAAWNSRVERTCRIESSYLNDFTSNHECWYELEMQCGYKFTWDEMEPPTCCPNCGARVVKR